MEDQEDRTPAVDGPEPVHEHPPENPGPARTGAQYGATVISALVLIAALLWLIVPFGGH